MSLGRKQSPCTPNSSPSKKKAKSDSSPPLYTMADPIARLEKTLMAEFSIMREEFTNHMATFQGVCSKLDFLMGEQREQKKMLSEHTSRLDTLERLVTDIQDRSRRNNIRIIGLPEGVEKDDPIGFIKTHLPVWLPNLSGSEVEVERAHRVYSRASVDHGRPRAFIFRLLRYNDRDRILKENRRVGQLVWKGVHLSFFPDFSPATAKKRSAFTTVRKAMREAGIQSFLIYPAVLKVIRHGESHLLQTPEDAQQFMTAFTASQ